MPRRRASDPARRVAFDALRLVHAEGAYANLVLPKLLAERRISARDAAFATELLAGTCRREGTYDLILAAAAGRAISSMQPAVVDVLRLGTHSLVGMAIPAHAAVAATVDLGAATVGERVTGLINAVLRRVAARSWEEWVTRLTTGLVGQDRLVVTTAHPRWIVDAFAEVLPADELEAALLANNVPAEVTLAVRPGLTDVSELIAAGAGPGRLSPFAATWSGNPADLPAVRSGQVGVQDEGSQLVAWGLTRPTAPTGWWLDVCAGPGGKTALLNGLAAPKKDLRGDPVLAADLTPHRARLVQTAVRAYPRPATVVVADGTRPPWPDGSFSRVLADVPCTGLGALRRRPEARWRRSAESVEQLHQLQTGLLRGALAAVRPGGLVAYVTCSPHRRETSDVVEEVLSGEPGVSIVEASSVLPELDDARRGPYLQLWPHRHGTDAMFAAYLRRTG
jgi:16S rRNA (cytosine967-C5)-methyltransferase